MKIWLTNLNISKKKIANILLLTGLICLLTVTISGEGINKSLRLVFVHIFFIFLPGKAFVKTTCIKFKNNLAAFSFSYATGYVISIIIYIILLLLGIQRYCLYISLLLCTLSICMVYKKREQKEFDSYIEKGSFFYVVVIFLVVLITSFIVYVIPNRLPEVMGYQDMMGDLTYWFKNCVAATKGYPLPELSIEGLNLYWHLFSCFEVAYLHFVTGIEIYTLCFSFSIIWKMFLLVTGSYVLASYYLNKRIHIILVLLVVLFSSGLDSQTFVYYQDHLYRCSLAFEEGYAMSMFGLVIFNEYIEMKKKTVTGGLSVLLLYVGALGLKVSGGTLLMAGIGTRLLILIKKNWKNVRYYVFLLVVLLLYYTVSKLFLIDGNALTSSTSSHRMIVSPIETIFRSGYYESMFNSFMIEVGNKYIAYVIIVVCYLFQTNYAVSIPFVLAIIAICALGKADFLISERCFPLLGMVICGQALFLFLNHPGFSQVYFYFNTFAFASIICMLLIEKINEGRKIEIVVTNGIQVIVVFLVCASILYNIENYQEIYFLTPQHFSERESKQSIGQNDFSVLEVEGLRWVRDNLPDDVVLATNKVFAGEPENSHFSRTFITSCFSERQVYLEGFSSTNLPSMELVMNRLGELRNYYEGVNGAAELLEKQGVTHAILFKGLQDQSVFPEGEILYENDDLAVIDICNIVK